MGSQHPDLIPDDLLAGHYRIERELGRGGMAVVYRARDVPHDRAVAIKLFPADSIDPAGARRFAQEIAFAARLQHAHIVPLYDSGVHEGRPYYVMPCVKGESLRQWLQREPQLALDEALRLAGEIAEALAHAHERGVVHRDVKPENVLLEGGHARVADFGIGRALDRAGGTELTGSGLAIGTPAYMGPEQVSGSHDLDGRADLYSLGCVLYEMLAGEPPFTGPTSASVLHQQLSAPAPDVRSMRPDVPAAVAGLVARLLAKTPADRPRDANEVVRTLHALAAAPLGAPATIAPPARRHATRRWMWGAAGAVLAAAALAAGWWALARGPSLRSLAVLPLENLSHDPEQEYFADGMTEELINELGRISALRVISRTSAMVYKNARRPLPEIAGALHVGAVVEGSVMREGDRVRLNAELVQARPERSLWSDRYVRPLRSIMALQAELSQTIAHRVQATLTTTERTRVARAGRVDPLAHEAYLRGRYQLNRVNEQGYRSAMASFQRAIEIDSSFAAGWAGLSEAYYTLSDLYLSPDEAMPKARSAAERALQLDPDLAEARTALALVLAQYERRWKGAEEEYQASLKLDPSTSLTHLFYSQLLMETGRVHEALDEARRAQVSDPLSPYVAGWMAYDLYYAGDYARAIARYQEMLRADSAYAVPYYSIAQCDVELGRFDDAIHMTRRAEAVGDSRAPRLFRAYALARAGRGAEARALLDSLDRQAGRGGLEPWSRGIVLCALGDRDGAFVALDQALAAHSEDLLWIQVDPKLRALRGDPRYARLLKRMGFTG
jgi:eukaryotic-like serine/threonine-protein kinase